MWQSLIDKVKHGFYTTSLPNSNSKYKHIMFYMYKHKLFDVYENVLIAHK